MNTVEYAQAKYEMADILRVASNVARDRQPEQRYPFEDLFARLAEDRFNIALVGQFSRGKTSLMNALLNTECLPTGVIPLTSVVTTVQYGPEPQVIIEYAERGLPSRIKLDELPEFVTQERNPGNEKNIRFARVQYPAEFLRQGFYLIDTPGLGSAIPENTRTTERFLPEADAVVIVTSYDSPLSESELGLLRMLGADAQRWFIVLNKMDLVDPADRAAVENHVRVQLLQGQNARQPIVYAVSAREALIANRTRDFDRLASSGLLALMDGIETFVVEEKNSVFLQRMAERIEVELLMLGCVSERKRLLDVVSKLEEPPSTRTNSIYAKRAVPPFEHCAVCAPMEREFRRFLEKFQYRIIVEDGVRQELHAQGGLCPLHTWQYAALASSHGTCVAFPGVFERMVDHVRTSLECESDTPNDAIARVESDLDCVLCRVRREAEVRSLAVVTTNIYRAAEEALPEFPDICRLHLGPVISALPAEMGGAVLDAAIKSWKRIAEDMRRYALKRDGSRRALTTDDELDADVRGLRALAGHRALSYAWPIQR